MRKWIIKPHESGLDALTLVDGAIPEPGPGQVRIAVKAASLNYRDQIILNGGYGQVITTDTIPASDAAGVIDAVGEGVDSWAVGDDVITVYFADWVDGPPPTGMGFGLGSPGEDGVLAEYITLPADRVVAKPKSLDYIQAATLTCAGLTAWTALTEEHPVLAGQTVLTLGSGGVSVFALQLAQAMGATVIVTTGGNDKSARLIDLGAARVINYRTDETWGETAYAATGGADKVVNAAGGDAMLQSIMAVANGGEIAVMGVFSDGDAPPPLPILMAKGASIRGTAVGGRVALQRLVEFVDTHGIAPVIHKVYGFDDVKEAYAAQASPDVFGKVVIAITN
ncbi:zinc-dependent alcohol dehydrogenase family protein [Mycolicibacterium goodii]|uniref:Enoyl reductase (ER) domain-containing protein n=1 Tax=Mycolicibacterium goodii TaxID=134601 RepID=A0A0K0X0A1_MYCGD|nr:hypothetical protein AFA91_02180 [Mycolicibacterium goodii]